MVEVPDRLDVAIRVGPGPGRPAVRFMPNNRTIEADAISPDGEWLRLDFPGLDRAWVAIEEVETEGDCLELPENDGTVIIGVPPPPPPPEEEPETGTVVPGGEPGEPGEEGLATVDPGYDCTGFRPTSPLSGMTCGFQTFYWDPAARGVDLYRFIGMDEKGSIVAVLDTRQTSQTADTSGWQNDSPAATTFGWRVEGLDASGRIICRAGPVYMPRVGCDGKGNPVP
jgi:hypothetical protein